MFRLENVSKTYQQSGRTVDALQPTNLEIASGEFAAIVGPSGSGKSTLLSLLGGMLAPSGGKIWFGGQSIYDLSVPRRTELRRVQMGFVFQAFNLVPYLTAQENVEVPLLLAGHSRKQQRHDAAELLERVGLSDRADHKPSQLSTGQQQRVAFARTLANNPSVVFADEPTGNLDPETRDNVLAFLDDLHGQGKTIILVTHDHQHVASRATRIIRIAGGIVSADVPTPRLRLSA